MPHNNKHPKFLTRLICSFLLFMLLFKNIIAKIIPEKKSVLADIAKDNDDIISNSNVIPVYSDVQKLKGELLSNGDVRTGDSEFFADLKTLMRVKGRSFSDAKNNLDELVTRKWTPKRTGNKDRVYRYLLYFTFLEQWEDVILTDELIENKARKDDFGLLRGVMQKADELIEQQLMDKFSNSDTKSLMVKYAYLRHKIRSFILQYTNRHGDICDKIKYFHNDFIELNAFTNDSTIQSKAIRKYLSPGKIHRMQHFKIKLLETLEKCADEKVYQEFAEYRDSLQQSDSISSDLNRAILLDKEWANLQYTIRVEKHRFLLFVEIIQKWQKDILTDNLTTIEKFIPLQQAFDNATHILNNIVARNKGIFIEDYVDEYESVFWKMKLYTYILGSHTRELYKYIDELESDIENLDLKIFKKSMDGKATENLKSIRNELKTMLDQYWKNVYSWSYFTFGGAFLLAVAVSWFYRYRKKSSTPVIFRKGESDAPPRNKISKKERRAKRRRTRKEDKARRALKQKRIKNLEKQKRAQLEKNIDQDKSTNEDNSNVVLRRYTDKEQEKINNFIAGVKTEFKSCKGAVNITKEILDDGSYFFCFQRKTNVSDKKFSHFDDDLEEIKKHIRIRYPGGVKFFVKGDFPLQCRVWIPHNASQTTTVMPDDEQFEDVNVESMEKQNNIVKEKISRRNVLLEENGKLSDSEDDLSDDSVGNDDDLHPHPKHREKIFKIIKHDGGKLAQLQSKILRSGGGEAFRKPKFFYDYPHQNKPRKNFKLRDFPRKITDDVNKYITAWNFVRLCHSLIVRFPNDNNNRTILLRYRNNLIHNYCAVNFYRLRDVIKELLDLQDGEQKILSPHQSILKYDIKTHIFNIYKNLNNKIDQLYINNHFEPDAENLQQVKKVIIDTQHSLNLHEITSIANLSQTIIRRTQEALQVTDEYVNCVGSFGLNFDDAIRKCCQIDEEYIPKEKGMPTLKNLLLDLDACYIKLHDNYHAKAAAMILSLITVVIRHDEELFYTYRNRTWYQRCNAIRHGDWHWDNPKELTPILKRILNEFQGLKSRLKT